MKIDDATLRALEANADLVLSTARGRLGQDVGFDERGVSWLDGYVQRQHEAGDPDQRDGLVNTLGAYLGKCIIETYGGVWARVDGVLCVAFDSKNNANPFAKVAKHLDNGREDSCLSFFTVIPIIFKEVLRS